MARLLFSYVRMPDGEWVDYDDAAEILDHLATPNIDTLPTVTVEVDAPTNDVRELRKLVREALKASGLCGEREP